MVQQGLITNRFSRLGREEFLEARRKWQAFNIAESNWHGIILRQVLERALRNDNRILRRYFKEEVIAELYNDFEGNMGTIIDIVLEWDGIAVVFFADFARAFWGEDLPLPGGMLTRNFLDMNKEEDQTLQHTEFVWQYHLFRMAREGDPLIYLQKFLREQ